MTTGEAPPKRSRAGVDRNELEEAVPELSIKHSAVRGIGWTSFIQVFRVTMGLLTTWVLAIWLSGDAFGLVGCAAVLVGFLMLWKDLGTGSAIVQRKDLPDRVLSSVFWTNASLGVVGTAALYLLAPVVGRAFGEPELVAVLHALSLTMLFAGLGTTHQFLLQRELRFARLAKIETIALTAGAAAGITGAVCGAGVWALVMQALVTTGITSILAVLLQGWRPALVWRLDDVRGVAKFSLNLTGFNVMNYAARNADQILVFSLLGKGQAGLYYLAVKLLLFPISSINSVLSRVLFPLFAKVQDDDARLRNAFLKVTSTIAMLVLPFVVGFAVMAEPIIAGLLPAKWSPIVPLAIALAVVAAMQSLTTSVGNIYLAKARTDLLFLWGGMACVASVLAFAIGVQFGTVGVARAYAIFTVLFFWPALAIPLRLIGTPMTAFFGAVWRPVLAAAVMGLGVAGTGALLGDRVEPLVDVAIRVPLGVVIYVACSLMFNRSHVGQVLDLLRRRRENAGDSGQPPATEGVTTCSES